jgi:hypothetical protein
MKEEAIKVCVQQSRRLATKNIRYAWNPLLEACGINVADMD